jgi:hypothetical protein
MITQAVARFCPHCASAAITESLLDGTAHCESCKKEFKSTELVTTPFTHDMSSDEQVVEVFFKELRNIFARNAAKDIGELLVKWGFLPSTNIVVQKKMLIRFFESMSKAMAVAVFDERKKMETEAHVG